MGIPCVLMFFWVVLVVGGSVLWVWTIVDCATKEPSEGNDKIIWILIIIFTHWVGALIYMTVRRPRRIAQYGR